METILIEETEIEKFQTLTSQAVREVFKKMGSTDLTPENPAHFPADPAGLVVGSVGFSGTASGCIYLYTSFSFARNIASRMLAIPEFKLEGSKMVSDVMGELTNMVAGNVKSRLCDHGWTCVLATPTVLRGHEPAVKRLTDCVKKTIGFRHADHHVVAELWLKKS